MAFHLHDYFRECNHSRLEGLPASVHSRTVAQEELRTALRNGAQKQDTVDPFEDKAA